MLRSTLGQFYRVTIQDGRIFIGAFVCVDKEKNMVLTNTEEFCPDATDMTRGRYVGLVMIPWRWVVKAEVEHKS
ncbi:uncharacterized protein EI90DRAFT_3050505 [Cantharellus anzutake]|uniref:uncharacterized protein n=1 Tax=Cantharellus anzutake TaxID=1750568 RepID=UPI0019064696|nr:uncharacterized protein EI90DRAFT_3050505 [Cantharellus anzutake]KAF8333977.1 hypothetical protein EI90DRAFT_3050505 [Cantharellus anzutake]